MANEFFKIDSLEKYNEVHEKYLRLTPEEIKRVSVAKSRIYVSVEGMDLIQDAFQILLQTAESIGGLNKDDKRRIMQMGYSLEEVKQKLIKDIAKGRKKNG